MTLAFGSIYHPDYLSSQDDWRKWRLAYCGGRDFVDEYLERYKREPLSDFKVRKNITYCPAFAKSAITEIRNALFTRLNDVVRTGGPASYREAVLSNVDGAGSSMRSFIGCEVLPELLAMGRVGIWVDREPVSAPTLADAVPAPYLYAYRIEDIRSWTWEGRTLTSVMLRHCDHRTDEATGLPYGSPTEKFIWARLTPTGVEVVEENDGKVSPARILDLPRIPFVVVELSHSLMEDIADYQIALLNMASADVSFATKSNFPFYVEQFDPRIGSSFVRPAQQTERTSTDGTTVPAGQAQQAGEGRRDEVIVGTAAGRRYPKDLNQPAFIHPSPEPLRASMDKQQVMKEEIRALVHLSVATLDPNRASAESKAADDRGLHNGLVAIAAVLEKAEREIAEAWAAYEHSTPATVRYPDVWTMLSDDERQREAAELKKQLGTAPSATARKEIAKRVVELLIGHRVSPVTMDKIKQEIDAADAGTFDPEEIRDDVERGLLSADTASIMLGYAAGEAEKAKEELVERLTTIAISQSQGAGAARGVPMGPQDQSGKMEKEVSRKPSGTTDSSKMRGEAK